MPEVKDVKPAVTKEEEEEEEELHKGKKKRQEEEEKKRLQELSEEEKQVNKIVWFKLSKKWLKPRWPTTRNV